ncbi:MAG TPA: DUF6438 domain-containing protein [Allosphingosinicella sp.]|nr:DUF6438 domain-containing protein [Allosphingosinicella sp.]
MRLAAAAWLALAAAAPATAAPPERTGITYQTHACFGFCPVYRVTVSPDGAGLFEGRAHVAIRGQRRFRISPAQFRAFARHLEPARPATGSISYDSSNRCRGAGMPPTDGSAVGISWVGADRRRQSLYFYNGCQNRELRDRLARAPRLLPIAGFIGPPCTRNCSR